MKYLIGVFAVVLSVQTYASDRQVKKCIDKFKQFTAGKNFELVGRECSARVEIQADARVYQIAALDVMFLPHAYNFKASQQTLVLEEDWKYKDKYQVSYCELQGNVFKAHWVHYLKSGWKHVHEVSLQAEKDNAGKAVFLSMQVNRRPNFLIQDAGQKFEAQECLAE